MKIYLNDVNTEYLINMQYTTIAKSKLIDKFDKLYDVDKIPEPILKNTGLSDFSLVALKKSVDMLGIKNDEFTYIICFNKKEVTLDDLAQYVLFMLAGNFKGIVCYSNDLDSRLKKIVVDGINWDLIKIESKEQ